MYFVQFLLFFWLGLTGYCSSQWANLDDATPSAPQNKLDYNSGIAYDTIGHGGWDSSSPENNSPVIPITIAAEDFQACSSNKYQLSPTKRRLRREWCRDNEVAPNNFPETTTNPKPPSSVQEDKQKDEGSGVGQLESGEKAPTTNENPQLPSFPGREQFPGDLDSNPCNGPSINPVCSALEVRRALYPFSLVWKATWLDYCRMCTWNLLRCQKPYYASLFFLRKKKPPPPQNTTQTNLSIAQIIRDKNVSRKLEKNFTVAKKSEMR